jgi:hypothetical protein
VTTASVDTIQVSLLQKFITYRMLRRENTYHSDYQKNKKYNSQQHTHMLLIKPVINASTEPIANQSNLSELYFLQL